MSLKQYPCPQCGANLAFKPGTEQLECDNCGYQQAITTAVATIVEELDFESYVIQLGQEAESSELLTTQCPSCQAETTMEANVTSAPCPYCGTNMVFIGQSQRLIKPQALLPFKIPQTEAQAAFRDWLSGLWFAPNGLLKQSRSDKSNLTGIYMPHWTYDSRVTTHYTGEKGIAYYVTQRYTTTDKDGKRVTRTRQVRKIRWHPASGTVHNGFDDILVVAGTSLPDKYIDVLEPWDLAALTPYQDDYLTGFRAESYRIGLQDGVGIAKQKMQPTIDNTIRQDIGGDEQRIHDKQSRYYDITFKHILLPVWLNAYRYQQETYRFLVNAHTGEVQGERPISWIKVILAVLADITIALIAGGLAYGTAEDIYFALFVMSMIVVAGLGAIYALASEGFRK